MSKKPSFRDLEKLSAYLDGELSASAYRKMKDRLARDPNLVAALDDLRQSRAVLRRTPKRRVPRNFTLSPQMVAQRPPMPRLVPALNYASLAAILLFVFSFLSPFGLGDSTVPAQEMMAAEPMAMEAPAAEEAPAMETAAEPAADSAMEAEAPAAEMPAAEAPAGETGENFASAPPPPAATAEGIQAEKTYASTEIPAPTMTPTPVPPPSPVEIAPAPLLTAYQRTLVILLGLFAILSWAVRRATIAKWQKKAK